MDHVKFVEDTFTTFISWSHTEIVLRSEFESYIPRLYGTRDE